MAARPRNASVIPETLLLDDVSDARRRRERRMVKLDALGFILGLANVALSLSGLSFLPWWAFFGGAMFALGRLCGVCRLRPDLWDDR